MTIKHISLVELNEYKKNANNKLHKHKYEHVFLYHPGQGLLNHRVYKLCKICAEMKQIKIDDKMNNEINTIIEKKRKL